MKNTKRVKELRIPDIAFLDIPEQEKGRLDEVAVRLIPKSQRENHFPEDEYAYLLDDLRILEKLGIMEKEMIFVCPECGEVCGSILEADLSKYKRVWELLEEKAWSHGRDEEFLALCGEGVLDISVQCTNVNCSQGLNAVINDSEGFGRYAKYTKYAYRFECLYNYWHLIKILGK